MLRILLADDDAEFAFGFRASEVLHRVDAEELIRMAGNKQIPSRDVSQGVLVYVAFNEANSGVKDADAGILEALKIAGLKALRIGFPDSELPIVERQQAQHVDDGGLVNQIHRPRRVLTLVADDVGRTKRGHTGG